MKGYISLLFIHLVQPDWGGEGTLDKVGHLLTIKGNIKPKSPQKLMDKIFLFVLCCSSGGGVSGNV